ncbi:hydroxyacid dehydrogenase, partial [Candidatus Woesearchaeota archaeon]|nr:hydroxyacid dehydrogenase [Candidatus Woesearchaeota archaeon]
NRDPKLARKLGFRYVKLPTLFKNSDIVTLHVPENKHTRHMINKDTLKQFKEGSILINTSRGGLIDTYALVKALMSGKVGYAGLDVLEDECFIKEEKELLNPDFIKTCNLEVILQDNMLIKNPNVYVTPHNAFNSREALLRIVETTMDNIKAFLRKKPINEVDTDV